MVQDFSHQQHDADIVNWSLKTRSFGGKHGVSETPAYADGFGTDHSFLQDHLESLPKISQLSALSRYTLRQGIHMFPIHNHPM